MFFDIGRRKHFRMIIKEIIFVQILWGIKKGFTVKSGVTLT